MWRKYPQSISWIEFITIKNFQIVKQRNKQINKLKSPEITDVGRKQLIAISHTFRFMNLFSPNAQPQWWPQGCYECEGGEETWARQGGRGWSGRRNRGGVRARVAGRIYGWWWVAKKKKDDETTKYGGDVGERNREREVGREARRHGWNKGGLSSTVCSSVPRAALGN